MKLIGRNGDGSKSYFKAVDITRLIGEMERNVSTQRQDMRILASIIWNTPEYAYNGKARIHINDALSSINDILQKVKKLTHPNAWANSTQSTRHTS